ncbi:hypothetical protein SAMN02927914_06893 [Mesorhizobium qingshengii]|uniref:Uncharacterized protein n=1 Tax=Mesorhizobium qingshengii TaxID=1165689 RepID=A0A1G5ZZE5_9HYPH|nr:hypothetical protein SAMN02927914_06893 [Mesorhizobium qingshengii]
MKFPVKCAHLCDVPISISCFEFLQDLFRGVEVLVRHTGERICEDIAFQNRSELKQLHYLFGGQRGYNGAFVDF